MSDYVKLTDYAAKDALLSGNPAKIIKGVDIGADFDAVAVAVATKWDASVVNSATSKATPVDADLIPIVDSAASNILKKLTWANLKATLLTWLQGTVFPSPGAIGGTTPSTGAFTTVSASTSASTALFAGTDNTQTKFVDLASLNGVVVRGSTGTPANVTELYGGGTKAAVVSSTGLAVTGALSATSKATITRTSSSTLLDASTYIGLGGSENGLGGMRMIGYGYNAGDPATYYFPAYSGYVETSNTSGTAGDLVWYTRTNGSSAATAPSERMRLDNAGNLGLGVTPSAWTSTHKAIQIQGGGSVYNNGADGYINVASNSYYNGTNWVYVKTAAATQYIQSAGVHYWLTNASGTAGTTFTPSTAMTLDASGNLLVGTTSNANTSRVMMAQPTVSVPVASTHNTATSGDNQFMSFGTEASFTGRGSIDYNRAGGLTRYNTTSDKTLKTRVGPAPVAKSLEILDSTVLEEFFWNDDPTQKSQIGPFAQDLYEVYPGAVSVGGEYQEEVPAVLDDEGNEVTPATTVTKYRPWAVDKTAWTYHLIAGYKAQKAQIEELRSYKAQAETVIQDMLARMTAAGI